MALKSRVFPLLLRLLLVYGVVRYKLYRQSFSKNEVIINFILS